MRFVRVLALAVIAALFAVGAASDLRDRSTPDRAPPLVASLTVSTGVMTTWFCPGGSAPGGIAELTVEVISAAPALRTAIVTAAPGRYVPVPAADEAAGVGQASAGPAAGASAAVQRAAVHEVPPGGRVVLSPAEDAPGAAWTGAVVEVDGPDVIVEQVVADGQGGVGRSSCLTRTAERWIVPHGSTRLESDGERFVVMLLNPFSDFAVADVEMVADVGRDSIEGLVIPAGSVVAIDVTEEITVASSVSVLVDVVSGRLSASWIQLADGPVAGRGARMAPATPDPGPLWYLPSAAVGPGRSYVAAVANPSPAQAAEVDLEIIADDPGATANPIELTIPPGRTVLVDLAEEGRLSGIGSFTVVVRSLLGLPVAASLHSVHGEGVPGIVAGMTAAAGADAAALRWLVPAETTVGDGRADDEKAAFHDDASSVVIVNPSTEGIALVDLMVGGEVVRSLELGPQRRARLPLAWLGSGRFVLEVEASSPVIAAREIVGLTSRTASAGVAASEPVLLEDLR